jgi:hypothetical protein
LSLGLGKTTYFCDRRPQFKTKNDDIPEILNYDSQFLCERALMAALLRENMLGEVKKRNASTMQEGFQPQPLIWYEMLVCLNHLSLLFGVTP